MYAQFIDSPTSEKPQLDTNVTLLCRAALGEPQCGTTQEVEILTFSFSKFCFIFTLAQTNSNLYEPQPSWIGCSGSQSSNWSSTLTFVSVPIPVCISAKLFLHSRFQSTKSHLFLVDAFRLHFHLCDGDRPSRAVLLVEELANNLSSHDDKLDHHHLVVPGGHGVLVGVALGVPPQFALGLWNLHAHLGSIDDVRDENQNSLGCMTILPTPITHTLHINEANEIFDHRDIDNVGNVVNVYDIDWRQLWQW